MCLSGQRCGVRDKSFARCCYPQSVWWRSTAVTIIRPQPDIDSPSHAVLHCLEASLRGCPGRASDLRLSSVSAKAILYLSLVRRVQSEAHMNKAKDCKKKRKRKSQLRQHPYDIYDFIFGYPLLLSFILTLTNSKEEGCLKTSDHAPYQ